VNDLCSLALTQRVHYLLFYAEEFDTDSKQKYLLGHKTKCIVFRHTYNSAFVPKIFILFYISLLKNYLFVCVPKHYTYSCDHTRLTRL